MEEHEILTELGVVMDRLAALPTDAFAERFPLMERRDELRQLLADAQADAGRDAATEWADQAARKKGDGATPFHPPVLPDEATTFGG